MIDLDPKALRSAFSNFMTGVTVVTARSSDGTLVGFTANSFTSVSLNPPLLLVCPGNHLNSYPVFEQAEHFAVSILAEGQEDISNIFASAKEDRFSIVPWQPDANNTPIIKDACASFSCAVHERHVAGDHMILIGEVTQFEQNNKRGLGYCSNGYFSLQNERRADAATGKDRQGIAGVIIEYDNHILQSNDNKILCIPSVALSGRSGARTAMQNFLQQHDLDVTLGPVFSVYTDSVNDIQYTIFRAGASNWNAADLGTFIPLIELDTAAIQDNAQRTMMERFRTEHSHRQFGLYIGDMESGEVHPPQSGQE